jgi:hypothetical protein
MGLRPHARVYRRERCVLLELKGREAGGNIRAAWPLGLSAKAVERQCCLALTVRESAGAGR